MTKVESIALPNKTNLFNHPLLDYVANVKEYNVSPHLKNEDHVKRFKRVSANVHVYEPKSRRQKNVKVDDDVDDIEKFKRKKAEGLTDFYSRFGIKDRKLKLEENPNYYQFGLKNQNDTTFMITNWRKKKCEKPTNLEVKIDNANGSGGGSGGNLDGTSRDNFMNLYQKSKKAMGFVDLEKGPDSKKDDAKMIDLEKGEGIKTKK